MESDHFSLCWDNFHRNMSSGMSALLEDEDLVDVTLAADGKQLKAHKMVLSVCSPYFKELFKSNPCKHPIVFMRDVPYSALRDLLKFMYQGEVQVSQDDLSAFLKTAEALQIKGLTADGNGSTDGELESDKIQLVDDFKPRVKKTTAATTPTTSMPQPKRQRLNVSTEKSSSVATAKTEAAPVALNEVEFKMEPYDQSQSISIQDDDEQFGGEILDETAGDDTEDYTIMESTEEEPQAGTSTECAEGQDLKSEISGLSKKRKPNMPRYIVDGFVFHVNIMKGNPPMIYLRCLEYKRLGCHARAVLPLEGSIDDIKVNKPHNHPPDYAAEEKIVFLRELKEVMLRNPSVSSRAVYATLSEMYPNAARETPFDLIRHKMNRWRRQTDDSFVYM